MAFSKKSHFYWNSKDLIETDSHTFTNVISKQWINSKRKKKQKEKEQNEFVSKAPIWFAKISYANLFLVLLFV